MSDTLRLAVDARDLASDTRGIGRYTRAILRRLVHYPDVELTLLVFGPLPFLQKKRLAQCIGSDRFRVAGRPSGCDVVWHPANGLFFDFGLPNVVTIHDAVPFRFPDPDPERRKGQQDPFLRSIRLAARVIAVSEFDAQEIRDVFSFPAEHMQVIHHGVEPFFSPAQPPAEGRHFLFVGHPYVEKRKNFSLLYDAYCAAFPSGGPPLVVVGPEDPQKHRVQYAGLASSDTAGGGDEQIRDLYRNAIAVCVPSYYETFGMPAIEAMACGAPVIASRASCLPEIAGDAALYAPPQDRSTWSDQLQLAAKDQALRAKLRDAGLAQARKYDWDESARRHVDVFRAVR